MTEPTEPTKPDGPAAGHSAPVSTTASRLFDLRTILALMFSVYGIVLLVLGLFSTTDADIEKAGGWNINLDTGIAMLVLAIFFLVWVRLRPVRAPVEEIEGTAGDSAGPPSH
jgi:xanthine/uracil/vitamin C permease (AzgA family)